MSCEKYNNKDVCFTGCSLSYFKFNNLKQELNMNSTD